MARRYCGTLVLDVRYVDGRGSYDVRISERNADHAPELLRDIRMSPFDSARFAVDSPDAYDRVARAALSFASCEAESTLAYYADVNADGDYVIERRDPAVRTVTRVPLNRGGYTRTGMYFGTGEKVWRYTDTRGYDRYLRAPSKAEATAIARSAG